MAGMSRAESSAGGDPSADVRRDGNVQSQSRGPSRASLLPLGLYGLLVASGLWPLLVQGSGGPLSIWIWMGLWAASAGALGSSLRTHFLPGGALWPYLVPLVWGLALWLGPVAAPHTASGILALSSLYFAGLTLGGFRRWPWGMAALWFGACLALTALPTAGGTLVKPPPADWLARALDLSPVVWVCEHAGVDWMRHVSVYEQAGAGDLGPDQRLAWSGSIAPLLSCLLFVGIGLLRRRAQHSIPRGSA